MKISQYINTIYLLWVSLNGKLAVPEASASFNIHGAQNLIDFN